MAALLARNSGFLRLDLGGALLVHQPPGLSRISAPAGPDRHRRLLLRLAAPRLTHDHRAQMPYGRRHELPLRFLPSCCWPSRFRSPQPSRRRPNPPSRPRPPHRRLSRRITMRLPAGPVAATPRARATPNWRCAWPRRPLSPIRRAGFLCCAGRYLCRGQRSRDFARTYYDAALAIDPTDARAQQAIAALSAPYKRATDRRKAHERATHERVGH